ncbi:MAG TPA: hypothetical protein P5140_05650 [Methanofastidiosum sp.]|nr:hypothetical protein [Methanofastidiosum sp.]
MLLKIIERNGLYYCEIQIAEILDRKKLNRLIKRYKFKETSDPTVYFSEGDVEIKRIKRRRKKKVKVTNKNKTISKCEHCGSFSIKRKEIKVRSWISLWKCKECGWETLYVIPERERVEEIK